MKLREDLEKKLDALGAQFSLQWLKTEASRHPENVEALAELASLLTRSGHYEEGLKVDLRLATLRPADPIIRYNLACSYALMRRKEEALRELRQAVDLGYEDREFVLQDEDLKCLRQEPKFLEIVAQLEEKN